MMQSMGRNKLLQQAESLTRPWLIFKLGQGEYAIDIQLIQDIRSYQITSAINNGPNFIKGVFKVGGEVALIIDLRILFHITSVTYDAHTLMILLKVRGHLFTVVIDEAIEVISLSENDVNSAMQLSVLSEGQFIKGVVNYKGRILTLLDMEKLLIEDLNLLAKKTQTPD